MATSSSPQGQYCANCGTALDPSVLLCPNCRRFTHADQLQELSQQARQLAALGQLVAARDLWLTAAKLLPPDSSQYRGVLREVEKLNLQISPPPQRPGVDWRKRLGPFGVVLAFLAKFKTVGLVLLTKGKMLLSMFAFFGLYWALYGWWFALGIVGSVFCHEMGHYIAVKRLGFAAELPVFLPGFGAYVKWQGADVNPAVRAQISLAGPLFGLVSGLLSYMIYAATGQSVWLAVTHFAAWINLLNLIPVSIFDGGSAMNALGRSERLGILVICLLLWFLLNENLYLFVAAGTGYRLWKRDFPAQPSSQSAYFYAGLVVALGFLSWYSGMQMHHFTDR